ncbi:hypothetical protein DCC85_20825 [Paenibacillus sp. CAA11]|uniref:hypothetical protein n=1 Tax=Paenibacillus sp. CAA11 TaxID=1532905 RepID=UPI000D36496F|nr:hypothetical protein [Paenibacillus sp. CAA11]AWB46365.1 hypothetical protein DCC85_20825 [Paenibacillus sp. CAA11]
MKDFQTLKLLDRFRGLFERMGIQYPVMRRILQVKLTMDGRRVPTIASNSGYGKSKQKQTGSLLGGKTANTAPPSERMEEQAADGNRFLRSLWMYALIGLVLIPFVLMPENYMFQMSIVFGIIIFMISTSLVSDFSSVLLDIRDKNILFSKPVDRRTVNMAKALHILIYMFFITGAVTIPSLVAGLIRHGIGFFLIYLAEVILMDLLIVVLTALLYFVILKFFDGEKLKDIINYVQIGLTIGITVGYQLVVRLFDVVNFSFQFEPRWWQFLLPPVWFAAPFEVLLHRELGTYYVMLALLALAIPLAAIMIYIKLMPAFERNLSKLSEQAGKQGKGRSRFWTWLSRLITSTHEESVFFGFASTMMSREREFKLKVYPTLGFSIIFPFIFLFAARSENGLSGITSGRMYLFVYFCALLVPSVVLMLRYSGNYKGAWVFRTIPLKDMGSIYKGTLKAFLARLLVPLFLIESVVFAILFGVHIIPDLIAVLLALFMYTYVSHLMLSKELPFTQPFQTVQSSETVKMIGLMIILAAFAGVHYAATLISYGVYGYIVLLVVANAVIWRYGFTSFTPSSQQARS